MQNIVSLFGRIFLSAIFLLFGLKTIGSFSATQQYMASYGMPVTGFLLTGAIILELFGSVSLILGYKTRWGALALIIFLIPATLIFHTRFSDQNQFIHLMKNLAMLGGLLVLAGLGPGSLSLDNRKKPSSGGDEGEKN